MTKKIITAKKDLVHLDIDMEVIPLDDLVVTLSTLIEEYGKDAYIDKEFYGHDGAYDLYLYYERFETDKEYDKRLEREAKEQTKKAKQRAEKEELDKKEYERLKKKFGDA